MERASLRKNSGSADNLWRPEDRFPRCVEVKPALGAEPACRQLRYVQKPMTHHADQLCAIPCEKIPGRLPHAHRMAQKLETDRAPASLVSQGPAQRGQRGGKCHNHLHTLQVRGLSRSK